LYGRIAVVILLHHLHHLRLRGPEVGG